MKTKAFSFTISTQAEVDHEPEVRPKLVIQSSGHVKHQTVETQNKLLRYKYLINKATKQKYYEGL